MGIRSVQCLYRQIRPSGGNKGIPESSEPVAADSGLLLFSIAFVSGIRFMVRYRRYMRYFRATGLTRCTEDNVTHWLATRDVTK